MFQWRARTALMFVAMTGILVVLGSVVGALLNSVFMGMGVMLGLSILFNVYAYFCSKSMALRSMQVRLIDESDDPRFYRIVRGLAQKADIPMPEVGISEMNMPNAFATGRGPKDAAVVATRSLLDMLSDDELEGVLAHEISHVKNRDILVMSVASTMASIIAYAARMTVYASMFGDRDNAAGLVLAIIADVTLPIAAMIIQLGVSRNREYLADESGARLTGKPMALASALVRIENGCSSQYNRYDNPSAASMWISNPFGQRETGFLTTLFRTHPETRDRIERLKELEYEINHRRVVM